MDKAADEVVGAKAAMRRLARQRRALLPVADRVAAANAVAERFADVLRTRPAGGIVSGYLPIGDELDPLPSLLCAQQLGCRLCLPVMPGKRHVLVDDVSVMGGTLAELANHIQAAGGQIAGVITLVNASRAKHYAPSRTQISKVEARHGDVIRQEFGVAPAGLTAGEAGFLLNFRDADALRGGIAKARDERSRRLRAKGVRASSPEGEGGLGDQPLVALADSPRMPAPVRVAGIPRQAVALHSYTSDAGIKAHADYKAAKGGDAAAAGRLVVAVVSPDTVAQAREKFGPDVAYVAVAAEEQSGRNKIPILLAHYYAAATGAGVAHGIVQVNRAFHTGARPLDRMLGRPLFDGPVGAGKRQPLVFRSWQPGDPMLTRQWGILEPLDSAEALQPDILLVPLLAFDTGGRRLGYGGGFYDLTLAGLRRRRAVLAVGVAYDGQRVDLVPCLDYDEPLDWVLTPSGAMQCR